MGLLPAIKIDKNTFYRLVRRKLNSYCTTIYNSCNTKIDKAICGQQARFNMCTVCFSARFDLFASFDFFVVCGSFYFQQQFNWPKYNDDVYSCKFIHVEVLRSIKFLVAKPHTQTHTNKQTTHKQHTNWQLTRCNYF